MCRGFPSIPIPPHPSLPAAGTRCLDREHDSLSANSSCRPPGSRLALSGHVSLPNSRRTRLEYFTSASGALMPGGSLVGPRLKLARDRPMILRDTNSGIDISDVAPSATPVSLGFYASRCCNTGSLIKPMPAPLRARCPRCCSSESSSLALVRKLPLILMTGPGLVRT